MIQLSLCVYVDSAVAKHALRKSHFHTLHYTDELLSFGITTDEELYEASTDEENFYWVMNPWYEICCSHDEAYCEVFDDLDRAIAEAVVLRKEGHD